MTKSVIVLSGPMASGKTTLAERLQLLAGFAHAKTSAFLRSGAAGEMGRGVTFASGQLLDAETGGAWIAPWVRGLCDGLRVRVAVDAVRTVDQLEHLRRSFGDGLYHVHLTADESILRARFAQRGEGLSWADAQAFEFQQNQLAAKSDQQIQTDRITPDEIALRVCARLGAYLSRSARNVDVLIGGQYGSEGKGTLRLSWRTNTTCSYAAEARTLVIKFWEDAAHIASITSPSGSRRNKSAQIVLAPGATVYVPKLLSEIDECNVGPARLAIDPNVMIVEESDREFRVEGAGRCDRFDRGRVSGQLLLVARCVVPVAQSVSLRIIRISHHLFVRRKRFLKTLIARGFKCSWRARRAPACRFITARIRTSLRATRAQVVRCPRLGSRRRGFVGW
jgi:adenylosuccinate synthase